MGWNRAKCPQGYFLDWRRKDLGTRPCRLDGDPVGAEKQQVPPNILRHTHSRTGWGLEHLGQGSCRQPPPPPSLVGYSGSGWWIWVEQDSPGRTLANGERSLWTKVVGLFLACPRTAPARAVVESQQLITPNQPYPSTHLQAYLHTQPPRHSYKHASPIDAYKSTNG